ncbi:unnamed protein product [marine sediment metagenome]|uniref:Uncharacterized protein n=1 Tax=marine sediment metagenome TaxID=412755 RepID=X0RFM0_9ZZZZ
MRDKCDEMTRRATKKLNAERKKESFAVDWTKVQHALRIGRLAVAMRRKKSLLA